MSVDTVRAALLWCTAINYALLIAWYLIFLLPHAWIYRLSGRWFRLSVEQFDALNLCGIMMYKMGVLLFNLVPYIALRIVT